MTTEEIKVQDFVTEWRESGPWKASPTEVELLLAHIRMLEGLLQNVAVRLERLGDPLE